MYRRTEIFLFALLSASALALPAASTALADDSDDAGVEVVVVTGVQSGTGPDLSIGEVPHIGLDNSDLLRLFPGGNRNSNGPVTRISQYRGLFGAQNNISIDGLTYTSGGPNWMDTSLSSITQSLTRSVTLYRGLGTVAKVEEGLGGAISITSQGTGFSEQDEWGSNGRVEAGYGDNADSWSGAVRAGLNNRTNWFDIAASFDKGDDYQFAGGTVAASEYDRKQSRLGYGHRFDTTDVKLGAVINRTGKSGTPALPMDIIYMDSEQYSLGMDTRLAAGEIAFRVNTLSVDHLMDNFTLRPVPVAPSGMKSPRQTLALGDSDGFKLTWAGERGQTDLAFGVDGKFEQHDADVGNPNNAMFYIANFNDVKRDRVDALERR